MHENDAKKINSATLEKAAAVADKKYGQCVFPDAARAGAAAAQCGRLPASGAAEPLPKKMELTLASLLARGKKCGLTFEIVDESPKTLGLMLKAIEEREEFVSQQKARGRR